MENKPPKLYFLCNFLIYRHSDPKIDVCNHAFTMKELDG